MKIRIIELLLTNVDFRFDVLGVSETWMKIVISPKNKNHTRIPGTMVLKAIPSKDGEDVCM